MSKSVPCCAKSYVHLAVRPLFVIAHRVLAPDRACGPFRRHCVYTYHITLWHRTGHRPFRNTSCVRSLFVKSRRGTGPGTDKLRVVSSNTVFSAAPRRRAPALGHVPYKCSGYICYVPPRLPPHMRSAGRISFRHLHCHYCHHCQGYHGAALHPVGDSAPCVRLPVRPPFVTSRRATLPCPVRGFFDGPRVRLALALSRPIVTSYRTRRG